MKKKRNTHIDFKGSNNTRSDSKLSRICNKRFTRETTGYCHYCEYSSRGNERDEDSVTKRKNSCCYYLEDK